MVAQPPHYKGTWDWTTIETGWSGKLKSSEIDLSNIQQAADRFGKLLGIFGLDTPSIEEGRRRLLESENPESYIRHHLSGHGISLVFTSASGTQDANTKEAK